MDYLRTLVTEGGRIGRLAREGPLDAPVPHIPRWTVERVVAHLGGVHRWAEEIVRTRDYSGQSIRMGTDTGPALVDWFDEGLARLVETLSAATSEEACSNFSPGSPRTVGFWHRRQAHEAAMHRWDVEAALGLRSPFETPFASDGIDELFRTFTRTRGKQELTTSLRIAATDTGHAWTLVPADKPGRVEITTDDGEAENSLSGSAEEVLLALWKRLPLDGAAVDIDGDVAAVARFVAGPISP